MDIALDNEKIVVYLLHGNCFIWNASDAKILREDYRIVGTLVGSLPRAPRQNTHLGLPLQLLPEETSLLLEKGFIELLEEDTTAPGEEHVSDLKRQREESYLKQAELFKKERKEEIRRNLPLIIEGKKAKRRKLLEDRQKKGEIIDESEFEKDIDFDVDDVPITDIKPEQALVEIYLETPPGSNVSHKAAVWTYPSTESEKLRYRVFKELWEQGFYLTSGSKFGGDFLVYPGDPSRFHSFYIALCVKHSQQMSALDVVTKGRLGSNVKKTVVLCSEKEDGKICFMSLQWTGWS